MRTIQPEASRLEVFDASNKSDQPDTVVPAKHIISPDIPNKMGPLKAQGSFELENSGGRYTRGDNEITVGDRVELYVAYGPTYSVGHPDPQSASDDTPQRRFTGVVRSPETEITTNRSTFSFDAENFCGFILANRTVEAGFSERLVSDPDTGILQSLLTEYAPEIGQSKITDIDVTTSITFNAAQLLKCVRRLIARGDVVVSSDGRDLVVRPLDATTFDWELEPHDWGVPFKLQENDDTMANNVRLDGGEAVSIGTRQLTQSNWVNVTKNSRMLTQIDMPKDEVVQVDLWTDPRRTQSGDGVVVRLQRDIDGAPADVSDSEIDFARRTLAADFLEHNGLTTFIMPEHDIVDHTVWLIVEADDEGDGSGQDIGADASGTPTFQAGYPYPISARDDDRESIEEYRRRDRQISDESITSMREASQEVQAILNRNNIMKRTVTFPADSLRAHNLQPLDGIHIDNSEAGVVGDFIVIKAQDKFDGPNQRIETEVELQDIKTI